MTPIALGQRPSCQKITSYSDVLQFGKHKGHTVEWIIEHVPGYLLWAQDNKVIDADIEILEVAMESEFENDETPTIYDSWLDEDIYDYPNWLD